MLINCMVSCMALAYNSGYVGWRFCLFAYFIIRRSDLVDLYFSIVLLGNEDEDILYSEMKQTIEEVKYKKEEEDLIHIHIN